MDNDPPPYLYKILSHNQWQATQNRKVVILSTKDDAFIHLATEEQLEKIINKYWSDASEIVILKLDHAKLQGWLVLEANVGGVTKYFHLYDGSIPFDAIVETKILYKKKDASQTANIVQLGDPALRMPARALSPEEIISPEIQDLINLMKITMRKAPGIGLAAPQIGKPLQLLVIEDVDHSHLTSEQLKERNRTPVAFHVIINPRLHINKNAGEAEFFEGCLSIPEFIGIVPRTTSVCVECLNERAEPIVIDAKGWYARILQHEIDHLNGILYIDRAILKTLMTEENYVKFWKNKSIHEIKSLIL